MFKNAESYKVHFFLQTSNYENNLYFNEVLTSITPNDNPHLRTILIEEMVRHLRNASDPLRFKNYGDGKWASGQLDPQNLSEMEGLDSMDDVINLIVASFKLSGHLEILERGWLFSRYAQSYILSFKVWAN